MFKLTNARGETVDINTPSLRAYTPTGLGVQFANTYSQYETYFIPTKSVLSQGVMQVYMKFGDIESQSYQSFSDFAQFLAYQPYTLEYIFEGNTYYRDARLQALTKTEIGGSTIDAFDRLNEIFTLEFINNWYNNKTAEYKSYDPDPNLGTYGKIYRPKYDPTVNRNYILNSDVSTTSNITNFKSSKTISSFSGQKIVVSVQVDYDNITSVSNQKRIGAEFSIVNATTNANIYLGAWKNPIVGESFHGRIYQTFDFTSLNIKGYSSDDLTLGQGIYVQGVVGTNVSVSRPKLEIGTAATDWTPAPEDNLAIPFGYAYAPYYVYQESNRPSNEKVMSLNNKSQYFGLQSGSPSVITVKGPCSVNPTWTVVQNGNVVATDGFVLTLTDNQKLVVSSYPEDQYARLYNPDGSYVDVSQLQDYTKTNFVQIPEGESTVLFYLDANSDVNITFKEERLLV
ncbi:phage distal tail protein domain-containing protein [Leuconostoc pseudomesenteroides]|uniref:phage distal tail protein domain-containing protein n=1 Tax=Leuconostoc pseudomesenteroides TaxID=33968 RepID=UPI001F54DDC7|nr:phage distal tail protein domain-containing protein [Leuconostoc pseudomesenteroides]